MILAVIPARGGSKRIPGKNIREFAGKPIIAYSIEAALQSGLFDEVVVSTDSPEIGRIAKRYGAAVPFLRPAELSGDHAATMPVIQHAIDWMEQSREAIELACCIYPTAPFVRVEDLVSGHKELKDDPTADFAFTVTSFEFPIFRAIQVVDNRVKMFWPQHEKVRSQDLPEAYHDAGQFYWGRPDAFRANGGFFNARSIPIRVPRYLVQDIDTLEDWERAERMYTAYGSSVTEAPRATGSR